MWSTRNWGLTKLHIPNPDEEETYLTKASTTKLVDL